MKPAQPTVLEFRHIRRLGKRLHRLPNIGVNAITDLGLDEASPTYGAGVSSHS
jgi:hypothetical protein